MPIHFSHAIRHNWRARKTGAHADFLNIALRLIFFNVDAPPVAVYAKSGVKRALTVVSCGVFTLAYAASQYFLIRS